jgi:hypothetical protein
MKIFFTERDFQGRVISLVTNEEIFNISLSCPGKKQKNSRTNLSLKVDGSCKKMSFQEGIWCNFKGLCLVF